MKAWSGGKLLLIHNLGAGLGCVVSVTPLLLYLWQSWYPLYRKLCGPWGWSEQGWHSHPHQFSNPSRSNLYSHYADYAVLATNYGSTWFIILLMIFSNDSLLQMGTDTTEIPFVSPWTPTHALVMNYACTVILHFTYFWPYLLALFYYNLCFLLSVTSKIQASRVSLHQSTTVLELSDFFF